MMGTQSMRHGGKVGRENGRCKDPMASRAVFGDGKEACGREQSESEGRGRGHERRSQCEQSPGSTRPHRAPGLT